MCCIGSMANPVIVETLKEKFETLRPLMSERLRRQWAATEAKARGHGGMTAVTQAMGLSRNTMAHGLVELAGTRALSTVSLTRGRRLGGEHKPVIETDPTVRQALETLVEPTTRGEPMSPLRWTCKSTRKLAEELRGQGHRVSARTVAGLLHASDYSLHANRKTCEGSSHPGRNAGYPLKAGQLRVGHVR